MDSKKTTVWSIAGFDPSAGAGVLADIKTFEDFKCHGCAILSTLTAQNIDVVTAIEPVTVQFFQSQIITLYKKHRPSAIKIGLLPSVEHAEVLKQLLEKHRCFVVYDPIISSSSKFNFTSAVEQIKILDCLGGYIDLITPNLQECQALFGLDHTNTEYASQFLKFSCKAVVIKGGHADGELSSDYFASPTQCFYLNSPRLDKNNVHGTGCCFSSAIAAAFVQGYMLEDALVIAKMYLNQGIALSGNGFFQHNGFPEQAAYLPWIKSSSTTKSARFPRVEDLGFYVIVDSAVWVERLASLQVNTIQLRIKDKSLAAVEAEIIAANKIAQAHNIKLFINDYWQLAIKHKVYGVHLGQEDLETADIEAIYGAGLKLGISTHCFYEVARAISFQPSYIAFGPIFTTTSKVMKFSARGLEQLAFWRKLLSYPMTAIGGINLENVKAVLSTGVESIAVISAVTKSDNVNKTVTVFQKLF